MPPSGDSSVYNHTSKFLTAQLQQLFQSSRLWDNYNATLAQLAPEYFNLRQQLTYVYYYHITF
jgi:hypothetical protein